MARARITLEIDDEEVSALFDRLRDISKDMGPVFADIGESLLNSTRERFRAKRDPKGLPWAPLSPKYQARKKKNKDKILILDGYLIGTLTYQASKRQLLLGTPRIYGAVHQFGARKGQFGKTKKGRPIPWGRIPARPFLGISKDDRRMILRTLKDYIEGIDE